MFCRSAGFATMFALVSYHYMISMFEVIGVNVSETSVFFCSDAKRYQQSLFET